MAQNKKSPLLTYAYVSQLAIMLIVLTGGGFLLGRYVFFKTVLSGGIFATIGAVAGIAIFIMGILRIGRVKDED